MSAVKPDTWLAVRLSALGDVVLTTGVLDYFSKTHGLRFHFLTRQSLAPLFENHPAVAEIIGLEEESLGPGAWLKTAKDLARKYKGLSLMDLHGNLRSRVLGMLWSGPRVRYPKFSLERRLYNLVRPSFAEERLLSLNVPQRYALSLERAAPEASKLRPKIFLTEAERQEAASFLKEKGIRSPSCALHPYATHPNKEWPEAHWDRLITLLERAGWDWFVVGRSAAPLACGAPEKDKTRNFTNQTGIRQTCALMERANALLTNDSGPMHLGTAVGTRVVALFGPTSRVWGFCPSGERDVVLEIPLKCRPCSLHGRSECKRNRECLESIRPEDAAAAVFNKKL